MTRSLAESLAGHSPDQWALDFLARAGFPATPANVQAVVSWEYAESGAGGGMFNPLNTTQGGYPGETDFNSVGVKNYARYEDGIAANAKVIRNGLYVGPVTNFTLGDNARMTCDAITRSPWGTGFIALRGVPTTPTPTGVVNMSIVASPHKPTAPGRVAGAVFNPVNPRVVTLTNGASIKGDTAGPQGNRTWSPPITAGAVGIGISPTIDRKGRTDGRGIVLQDSAGGTFIGEWS